MNFVTLRGEFFFACGRQSKNPFLFAWAKTQNISQCRNSICAADFQSCSEEQHEIALTCERLGVDTHPEKTDRAVSQFTVVYRAKGRGRNDAPIEPCLTSNTTCAEIDYKTGNGWSHTFGAQLTIRAVKAFERLRPARAAVVPRTFAWMKSLRRRSRWLVAHALLKVRRERTIAVVRKTFGGINSQEIDHG